jgi:uncharacterized protein with gpF-like domain
MLNHHKPSFSNFEPTQNLQDLTFTNEYQSRIKPNNKHDWVTASYHSFVDDGKVTRIETVEYTRNNAPSVLEP